MSEHKHQDMTPEEREDAELDAARLRLDAKRDAEAKAQSRAIVKARLAGEPLGKEGYDWGVVATGEGVVLVRRVPAIVSKRWNDRVRSMSEGEYPTSQDAYEYTASGVVEPDGDTYKAWHQHNDTVAPAVAGMLLRLYMGESEQRKGKR